MTYNEIYVLKLHYRT